MGEDREPNRMGMRSFRGYTVKNIVNPSGRDRRRGAKVTGDFAHGSLGRPVDTAGSLSGWSALLSISKE